MLAALTTASARAAPYATGTGPDIPWLRLILAFLFCALLAAAAIWAVKARYGTPFVPDHWRALIAGASAPDTAAPDRVRIVQRLAIAPGSQLIVLKRGNLNYLLHVTTNGATEIDRYPDQSENAA